MIVMATAASGLFSDAALTFTVVVERQAPDPAAHFIMGNPPLGVVHSTVTARRVPAFTTRITIRKGQAGSQAVGFWITID
jgi:hypothetical protein